MKANATLFAFAIVTTAASACGDRLLVGQNPDGGAPTGAAGQSSPTTGAAGQSSPTTGAAGQSLPTTGAAGTGGAQPGASSCGPAGDRYRPPSIAALKAALHGTWELCSALGLFSRPQDGVFIDGDDTYVLLTRVNGALVPQTGLENKGHLEYLDNSGDTGPSIYQVNFVGDHGGTIISIPVLSEFPRKVIINNNGVDEYTYGRVEVVPPPLMKVVTPLRISGQEAVTRLAQAIWKEAPSADLLSQAELGRFKTTDDLYGAVRQLLADPRARTGLGAFYRWWLELDELKDVSKDGPTFPTYSPQLVADMAAETETFGVDVTLTAGGTFKTLMTAPYSYINQRLANIYGVGGVTGDQLRKVQLDPMQRAGVITQPALQALNSYEKRNSPSRRGAYMLTRFQCFDVPAPPPNIPPLPDTLPTNVTVRQALAMSVNTQANCAACHTMLDPPGLAFETFDAIGRWRTTDNGFPIDLSNISILNLSDDTSPTTVDGPVAFASALAGSARAQECMTRQWLSFLTGARVGEHDAQVVRSITATFRAAGLDLKELIAAVLTSDVVLAPR